MPSDPISLSDALSQYLATTKVKTEEQEKHKELSRFVKWFGGGERNLNSLTPSLAEAYGQIRGKDPAGNAEAVKDFLTYCYKNNIIGTSLAKHVKLKKASRRASALARKAALALDITSEGYQAILDELTNLREERVSVAQEIRRAAADKDFRENAPLDAAREKQGFMEARIRELEDNLKRARLVNAESQDSVRKDQRKVKLGSVVKLVDANLGLEMVYTLVNPTEANPMEARMSISSPVGKALIDHGSGEEVEVSTPMGNIRYRIEAVE
jgi:transcription elongation factor GreA